MIQLKDLNHFPLVAVRKKLHNALADVLLERCAQAEYNPTISLEVSTFSESLLMVAEGCGLALTPPHCERLKIPGVVYRRLAGDPLKITIGILMHRAASYGVRNALYSVLKAKKNIPLSDAGRFVAA